MDQKTTPQPRRARRWLKRISLGLLLLIACLLAAGLVYQAVGARADTRNFPPPGQLVPVGDTQLHLYCMGSGSPTVILETLSGGTSVSWAWVQPEIARTNRVCSYDRAGRGWSEPGAPPADLWGTAENLHTLLQTAGIEGPYVLVGHSIGGLYVRAFASRYPQEVAGLVLVDSAHPFQFERFPEFAAEQESYNTISQFFPALARLGLFRLMFTTGGEIDFQDLPPRQHDELAAFWSSPEYFLSQRAESLLAPTIYSQAQELPDLGDLQLAVVTAGQSIPAWLSLQDDLAALSSNSIHLTIEEANHASLAFHPEHARQTSQAIMQVVQAFQAGE